MRTELSKMGQAAWRQRGRRFRRRATSDLVLILAGCLVAWLLASACDAFEAIRALAEQHEELQLDEVLTVAFILPFGLVIYAARRNNDYKREMRCRAAAQEEAQRLARHDALTGLPNRRGLAEALEAALARVAQAGGALGMFLIDLDRFKPVNDLYGHPAGDRLLREVAGRLTALARPEDVVARLGGDEFVLLAPLRAGPEEAARIAARVLAAVQAEVALDGGTVQVGASLGVALAPADAVNAEWLHRRADVALYRAKSEGRDCFRFFEAGMDTRAQAQLELTAELRSAVLGERIEPHFQPLVDLPTGRIIGFEVLARWQHPRLGPVPPARFIPMAEDAGLIMPLTESILRRACRVAQPWPEHLTVAVNLSPLQLADRMLVEKIRRILAETRFPAQRLELELTESALVSNTGQAREVMQRLKALGIRISLDDFGTGYSSLRHLQALPFDKIKIDASFIRAMAEQPDSRKIVSAVIGLGQSLGMTMLAEGIEAETEAEALRALGCPLGQGWLYGRAIPAQEVAGLLGLGKEQAPVA